MRFQLHTSHRLEALFDALADEIERAPLPPLVAETILVPGPGMARWLQWQLATRFGIAAGFRLPFFGAFLSELLPPGAAAPFQPDVLLFRLWRLFDQLNGRADFGPAAAYQQDDPDGQKRYQLCKRLAAAFDDYQLYRDGVLRAFARGETPKDSPHAAWQGELWRALLDDAGLTTTTSAAKANGRRRRRVDTHTPLLFPELAAATAAATADDPAPGAHRLHALRQLLRDPARARACLPPRLFVFGASTLPPEFTRLLQQMAAHIPVTLFVPQPTPHYIGDLRSGTADVGGHPLLARFGTEGREFADLLQQLEEPGPGLPALVRNDGDFAADDLAADPGRPASLLACLQQDLVQVHDRAAPSAERFLLAADDDSVRVHDCHSPQRELEVVRDQVFAAFAADATLRPHDVLVLVSDIDRYAPYAQAVFGTSASRLPFRVVDRNPANELPLCRTALSLLRLARSRATVFDVLHVLETQAVQRRFRLFPADLPTLRHLCHRAGIRWGIDGPSRASRFDLPEFAANSWRQGLTRLALGLLTGPTDDVVLGCLPVGGVTDAHEDLLERFLAFADTLFEQLGELTAARPLVAWADRIDALLATMFTPAEGDDETAMSYLQAATTHLRRLASGARHDSAVSAVVLGDWLTAALSANAGSRGFLSGPMTIAAMLPLRAVPARCLFLCGLDDSAFPRPDHPLPFDLIAANRRPGDRSRRLDDRQLFLDLLLAARERLHLTYVGRSAKDNARCTPSIVLVELLQHIDRTCRTRDLGRASELVTVPHALQPWSPRYRDGKDRRLFTYSRLPSVESSGLRLPAEPAWSPPAATATPPSATATATPPADPLPLDRLLAFWWHPCRAFLRQTLHLLVRNDDDEEDDMEPFRLHNLDKYRLQDDGLRRALGGQPEPRDRLLFARAGGVLPVGTHGDAAFAEALDELTQLLHHLPTAPLQQRRVTAIGRGFHVEGDVDGLGERLLLRVRTSRRKPKDHMRAWIQHLVLAVARAQGAVDLPATTLLVGSDGVGHYLPIDADEAAARLLTLVEHHRAGLAAPLPFFEQSSWAFAQALGEQKPTAFALRKARAEWEPKTKLFGWERGDIEDADIRLCMRGRDPLAEDPFAAVAEVWLPALAAFREGPP